MTGSEQFIGYSIAVPFFKDTSSIASRGRKHWFAMLHLVIFTLYMTSAAWAQTQLGSDIIGESSQIASNASVSLSSDGNMLAVGAPADDSNGSRSGRVRVHQWSGTDWVQIGSDINGERSDDMSGESVSLSADGSRVAIGAAYNNGNGADSGHVRIYQWSGTAWEQLGSDIDGEKAGDLSGIAISLSSDGNRLAIGASDNDDNGENAGHVRVYQWSGSAWTKLGSDLDGDAAGDQFGAAVSLSPDGNRLAVGAPWGKVDATDTGYVRVFQWSGTSWRQLGIPINGVSANEYLGTSVSLSSDGSRMAVGAMSFGYRNGAGIVRTYRWSGSSWEQLGLDIEGEDDGDRSGRSISLSAAGTRLAIGAAYNSENAERSGQLRLFQWTGSDWVQLGSDIDSDLPYDYFGKNVSLSADGNRVVSSTGNANLIGESPYHVRAYDFSMFNTFSMNAGMNDAWYDPETNGQGFFITVFPDLGVVSLAWFTYDTQLPPSDAVSNLGDPGLRWFTAIGPISGDQAEMMIEMTSGGIFDTPTEITRTDPPGSDGTILLTFDSCNSGTVEYDITSINQQGIVPIQRVANDNIAVCEALSAY